jgi:hypothetical protein
MEISIWIPLGVVAVALLVLLIIFRRHLLAILCTVGFVAGLATLAFAVGDGHLHQLSATLPPVILTTASLFALTIAQRLEK